MTVYTIGDLRQKGFTMDQITHAVNVNVIFVKQVNNKVTFDESDLKELQKLVKEQRNCTLADLAKELSVDVGVLVQEDQMGRVETPFKGLAGLSLFTRNELKYIAEQYKKTGELKAVRPTNNDTHKYQLTMQQTLNELQINEQVLRNLVQQGKIRPIQQIQNNGVIYFDKQDVLALKRFVKQN